MTVKPKFLWVIDIIHTRKSTRKTLLGQKGEKGPKWSNSISSEPLAVGGSLKPQNDRRRKFLSVFRIMYTDHTTETTILGLKSIKTCQRCPYPITSEPFVVENWVTPKNDHRTQVLIVFPTIYTHLPTGSDAFSPKCPIQCLLNA